ncbi:CobW/HypB/UreG, nucleotide-binding domain-containing protein [Podospora australis]|uniref:CobW/HypB/UreG, nucleotide-binding domain-containing protein n=1 Tax=Podospora australis TaxID=1536484 RepID=A0AAN7AMX1_9PEZI|nr:CobW/HypB/UreG, nucleotide-binding domain-containing protein [Podospora australis]
MGDIPPSTTSTPSTSEAAPAPASRTLNLSTATAPIPITILTGFLGAGKTTLILNLVPQLRALNPSYKLALLKNEFGDLAVDSQLASSSAIGSVKELLNGCICCNLVGSLSSALSELKESVRPDRIIIETSGSAFPATLALEVNRLARETKGEYVLDGVVSVIDVENWQGYEDTSYTARLQAKYTDLVVLNKWEGVSERRYDEVLDRLGDLEVDVARVRSDKGKVDVGVLFGVDGGLARELREEELKGEEKGPDEKEHEHGHEHGAHGHQKEVEVISVEFKGKDVVVDTAKLLWFLRSAPKDEVYRIKAILTVSPEGLENSDEDVAVQVSPRNRYILNWAFGRWTFTPTAEDVEEHESSSEAVLRMTIILARYESNKWMKKLGDETTGPEYLSFIGADREGLKIRTIE